MSITSDDHDDDDYDAAAADDDHNEFSAQRHVYFLLCHLGMMRWERLFRIALLSR